MLEPDTRELLLDALRPPDDCELVHAVGTTYSLDLQTLLFAPLAFAMFDWALDDEGPRTRSRCSSLSAGTPTAQRCSARRARSGCRATTSRC